MSLFGIFNDACDRAQEAIDAAQQALNNAYKNKMRPFVQHDTKVYAFNLATVSAITLIALTVISGLTTGNGFAFFLSAGILSLALRQILKISIEKGTVTANLIGGLKQSMAQDKENELFGYFFKFPALSFTEYKNNFHLLFR